MLNRRAARALLVAAAMALGASSAAGAQDIGESQKRLTEIRRERRELRDDLARLRTQVRDMSGELRNLDRQVQTSGEVIQELDVQLASTEGQITGTTRELISTQDQLAIKRALLRRRLRDIYKRGPLATVQALLTSQSFAQLLNRYKYLSLVARHDRALLEEVRALEAELSVRRRKLERNLARVQTLRLQRVEERAGLESVKADQQRTLGTLQTQERSTGQRIDRLARDEKRLATLIATLERKRREAEERARRLAAERARSGAAPAASAAGKSTLTTADLGSLGWPVDGRVVYRFGRATQPNGATIRWNGIGIAAPAGTQVRAVESGTVVLAAPFEGYGPTVVLSHGGGYYSLYLYLRNLAVAEGAEVQRGQTVGSVGGETTPEGSHLEFQIRAPGGQAVDPLTWLRKRAAR